MIVFKELTTEEIEVRVWAAIVLVLAGILLISVVCILLAVMFVDQDMERIAPIDVQFLSMMKDIMLLCIGAVGGIVGRKGAYAAANAMKEIKE
jgi:ATP/ADP translocase